MPAQQARFIAPFSLPLSTLIADFPMPLTSCRCMRAIPANGGADACDA
jgi:hypothetical protein